jgi:hypothetical protein
MPQKTSPRQPADRTIAVAIVPAVEDAKVQVQVNGSPDTWLHGVSSVDGYVAWQWSDSLGDSVLYIQAEGYKEYLQSVHWTTFTDPDVGAPPLNCQMTVGGNLPPLEPLHEQAPGPDPMPPVPPADEEGPLVIAHPTICDPLGTWRWKGFSDFLLFYRYLIGEDITPLINDRLGVGATLVRVFTMVAWDDITPRFYPQDFPDYYGQLTAFIALLAQHGLRIELVLFCDCRDAPAVMPNSADRDRHQERCIEAARAAGPETWNVIVEVANEPFKNLPNGNEEAVARAQQLLGCGFLIAAGNYDAQSSTNWVPLNPGDYGTTHVDRSDDWPRKCKDIYDLAMEGTHCPWIGDEPMGAAEENDPGRRSNVSEDFAWYAAGCAMFGPGATFHSDAGTHSTLLGPNQQTCARAFFAALDWVPTDAPYWPYRRGDMGSEAGMGLPPLSVMHDDALELRTYAKGYTDANGMGHDWVIQIRTSRDHATPRDGWRVVSEPQRGFCYLEKP